MPPQFNVPPPQMGSMGGGGYPGPAPQGANFGGQQPPGGYGGGGASGGNLNIFLTFKTRAKISSCQIAFLQLKMYLL